MAARITYATLLALIGQIYDATYDPARWPDFLNTFASAVGGRGTLIYSHNFETMEASTASESGLPNAAVNFDPHYLRSIEQHYNHVNVWAQNETLLEPGRPVTGSMLFPERELPKTEFYSDWLRPQDYFHAIGGIVVRDGPWAMKFSSLRSRKAGDFTPEEIGLYQALLPHLARAAHIQRRFAFLQSLSNSSLAVLDTVPAAVILLDARSRVLHSNTTAEAELRRADPLRLHASGELFIRGAPSAQAALRTIIAAALDPTRASRERLPTIAQVRRRSGEALSVQALPLPASNRAVPATMIKQRLAACALVVRAGGDVGSFASPEFLSRLYGLTPAEARAASLIAQGRSVPQAAEELGVSRNTLKTQLKSVFAKTGTHRQGELVRLWYGGVSPRLTRS